MITLRDLPVREGDSVEVVVIPRSTKSSAQKQHPLRDEALEYVAPFEPVADNDWESAS